MSFLSRLNIHYLQFSKIKAIIIEFVTLLKSWIGNHQDDATNLYIEMYQSVFHASVTFHSHENDTLQGSFDSHGNKTQIFNFFTKNTAFGYNVVCLKCMYVVLVVVNNARK